MKLNCDLFFTLQTRSDMGIQVEPAEKEVRTEGVQTSTKSSPRKQLSQEMMEDLPPTLHAGYAITPGRSRITCILVLNGTATNLAMHAFIGCIRNLFLC